MTLFNSPETDKNTLFHWLFIETEMKRAYCDFTLLSACFSLHQPSLLEHSAAGTTLKENTGLYTQGGNKNHHSQSGNTARPPWARLTHSWRISPVLFMYCSVRHFADLCVLLKGKPCRKFSLNNLSLSCSPMSFWKGHVLFVPSSRLL